MPQGEAIVPVPTSKSESLLRQRGTGREPLDLLSGPHSAGASGAIAGVIVGTNGRPATLFDWGVAV